MDCGVGGWRVHGVGGCVVVWVVVGWMVGEFMWWVHILTHQKSYNVKIFNFMKTHVPTHQTYPSVTLSLHIYFGWFMGWVVDGGGVVRGFMGWVVGGFMEWLCVVVWVVVGWVVGGFM